MSIEAEFALFGCENGKKTIGVADTPPVDDDAGQFGVVHIFRQSEYSDSQIVGMPEYQRNLIF